MEGAGGGVMRDSFSEHERCVFLSNCVVGVNRIATRLI